jgi:pimeloyl-ACP methyl ester carboxylesterase
MVSSDMRIGFRAVDGLQIRFAESDSSAGPRIILTSPWPESLLAFERIWSRLSSTARVMAVDLPGFGRSEGRTDLLSPVTMGEFGVLDTGHFVWEEAPDQYGAIVAAWVTGGYPAGSRGSWSERVP